MGWESVTRTEYVANAGRDEAWTCAPAPVDVLEFHRALPGYAPTRLVGLPEMAREYGVARLFAKDESSRLGLPAFKALGASWAIHRALQNVTDRPVTIVTATDGNHGRAVARFAREFGQRAEIFVPDGLHPAAIKAIRDEGAVVTHVPGNYDAAVEAAASARRGLLVQDTAWEGYEETPGWIVDGYSTLFHEIDGQLGDSPGLVIVPAGVGSLLQAALAHYRSRPSATRVVSVEPVVAACVSASVAAGRPVTVETGATSMAGLNCGTVSALAWPYIRAGLDGCVTVPDAAVAGAARALAAVGVDAGPCGAAPLAALPAVAASDATVILLVTEGAAANPADADPAGTGLAGYSPA
ncbi:pyridoxal-phosphate dependent enzyme [Actinoplanes sp. NPDC026670]|uniref:pyridoxal-phosphate dependent enzyme n=1 Tax=Actinoplanes sp. NPDC026670 TaxID=3154700 RepID=UPI0033D021BF